MEKLKCSSCGGEITIDSDKEYGTCPYCGTKYKLKKDINFNIKLDDNVKEVLNTGLNTAKHFSKFMIIPIVVFFVIFLTIFFTTIRSFSGNDGFSKRSFNNQFFNASGTKNSLFLEDTLDDIIESNKTNKKQITLEFEGRETTNEKEIIEIKHSLSGRYEVSFNYDKKGFINKIIIEKIH